MLAKRAGIEATHVPYKGADALNDLLGRPRAVHVRDHSVGDPAHQGRQAARASRSAAPSARARCRTCRPWPRAASRASRPARGSASSRPRARREVVVRRSTRRSTSSSRSRPIAGAAGRAKAPIRSAARPQQFARVRAARVREVASGRARVGRDRRLGAARLRVTALSARCPSRARGRFHTGACMLSSIACATWFMKPVPGMQSGEFARITSFHVPRQRWRCSALRGR